MAQEAQSPAAETPAAGGDPESSAVDVVNSTPPPQPSPKKKGKGPRTKRPDGPPPDLDAADTWELDCEICRERGWNVVRIFNFSAHQTP